MKNIFFIIFSILSAYSYTQKQEISIESQQPDYFIEAARKLYDQQNYKSALDYCEQAIAQTKSSSDISFVYEAYSLKGEILYDTEDYNGCIKNQHLAINGYKKLNKNVELSYCHHIIGMAYRRLNDYNNSMKAEINSMNYAEKSGDLKRISAASNGLGLVFHTLEKFDDALKYYQISLDADSKLNDISGMADSYLNIGAIYSDNKQPEKSLGYLMKSLELYHKVNDKDGLAMVYNNIGNRYIEMNDLDLAIEFHNKSLEIEQDNKNLEGIAYSYSNISEVYRSKKDYNKALEYKLKALDFKTDYSLKLMICDSLSSLFSEMGDYKSALYYNNMLADFKDSLYSTESERIIKELQTRYETEKKEKENELLKKDQVIKEASLKKQYILSISVSIGLMLMFLLAIVLYRSDRKRKKANFILARKNIEIQQKNEEISAQRDEIESQRDLVTLQKNHIEKMHEDVTSSIRYAKRIQNAVLPSSEQLNTILPEYFIIFMPRNIVSGDFYWITRAKNHIIFCVADCTGHGVPGAFMSLMGISYLNEIIIKEALTDPSKILDRLRAEVINSLKQKGEQDEQKDGMDIALCSMNIQTLELWYAGANNPLYIIRNNELIEFKGDKMPISIHERMNSFTLNEYKLEKNDCLYLVTDGFADQFGSVDKKKFSRKSFKNLILENSSKPMAEQKKIFNQVLNDWKGNSPQIDDITLMGIKI